VSDSFHLERTTPLLHSYVFDVERRTIAHDGATFERDVAVHPGAVAVLVIDELERIGVIRQYRSTFDRVTYEIPAGTNDVDGEDPLTTAQRELGEEMGCAASQWRLLGRFMTSPGWTTQVMTIFEARGITMTSREPAGPEETSSSIQWLSLANLREALALEPAIDTTMMVALHLLFGSFFDLN
jgi:ADP-ribose pyrophosphatase